MYGQAFESLVARFCHSNSGIYMTKKEHLGFGQYLQTYVIRFDLFPKILISNDQKSGHTKSSSGLVLISVITQLSSRMRTRLAHRGHGFSVLLDAFI